MPVAPSFTDSESLVARIIAELRDESSFAHGEDDLHGDATGSDIERCHREWPDDAPMRKWCIDRADEAMQDPRVRN